MSDEPVFMRDAIPALRKMQKLEADALTAALKLDEPVYVLGDSLAETWVPSNGLLVTRTYLGDDGDLHIELIDPKDLYEG